MLTVAWWHARPGGITSWLLVGPAPAPLTDSAWLHQLAVTTGEWAVVSQPPLGPLPERIAEALKDPLGPAGDAQSAVLRPDGERVPGDAADALRAECLDAALELVAKRLSQRIEPRESGVVLLRLRSAGGRLYLDFAPALEEEGWQSRSVLVDLGDARLDSFGPVTVALGSTTLELPAASLELAAPGPGAAIEVTLPTLWHAEVPEPVVRLQLEAARGRPG
jgi:hypothetical protein